MPAPPTPSNQVRNDILLALVNQDYQNLLPRLERVSLNAGEIVYRAEDMIQYAYFPEDSVISLLSTMEDGATTEVGLIGREGMTGLNIVLGGEPAHDLALVQVKGTAMRMKASVLREELRVGSPLQLLLLRYAAAFIVLISQSVICSQHHSVEQRYARWLLMLHDYVGTGKLRLTQELIADMIGSRRSGVTKAAVSLKKAGLISYVRGYISVQNREGLETMACECYRATRKEFDRLRTSQSFARKSA